jgi:hypothetical protein
MATRKGLARSRKEPAPASYDRSAWTFGQLLAWHLDRGTRPEGKPDHPGKPWGVAVFAFDIGKMNERSVRKWRKGHTVPPDVQPLEAKLFGDNPITGAAVLPRSDRRPFLEHDQNTAGPVGPNQP